MTEREPSSLRRTPQYRSLDITHNVKVFIELVRPSDMARSEPKEFTYLPLESVRVGSKRPRRGNESSTSCSISSFGSLTAAHTVADLLPATLPNMPTPTPMDINSEDFAKIIDELMPPYQQTESVQADAGSSFRKRYDRLSDVSGLLLFKF